MAHSVPKQPTPCGLAQTMGRVSTDFMLSEWFDE